jgi:hypothetical protein
MSAFSPPLPLSCLPSGSLEASPSPFIQEPFAVVLSCCGLIQASLIAYENPVTIKIARLETISPLIRQSSLRAFSFFSCPKVLQWQRLFFCYTSYIEVRF